MQTTTTASTDASAIKNRVNRFWDKIAIRKSGCWEWTGCRSRQGYGVIRFGKLLMTCHRVMATITFGVLTPKTLVIHSCDNKICVNPHHLRLGTHADNLQDAARKNLMPHKISNANVIKLRQLHSQGVKQVELSKMFSICQSNVSSIVKGITRNYV